MNVPAGEPAPHQEAHAHDNSQIHMAGRDQYIYHSSDGTNRDQVPVPAAGRALARMLALFCVLVTGVTLVWVAYDADGWIRGPFLLAGLACVVLTSPLLRPAVRRWRLTRTGRNPGLARLRERQLEEAAEQLARELAVLWNREMRIRRLQYPTPLPVRWVNAEEFGDHWTNIRTGDGRDAPLDLSGSSALHEVYSRIPSGRLLILGQAGAGKSVLALRFALDRLRARGPSGRVPVLLPMASWDPATQDLESWAAGRLAADHPALSGRAVSGETVAAELLRSSRLLPVLDGFDEMSTQSRHHALRRLRASLGEADPFLLTSRADEYEAAVRQADILLPATAAVRVEPLSVQESVDYLHRTTRKLVVGRTVATKWDPVFTRLREHPRDPQVLRLRDVLTTPLMTGLARITYSDTPRDPAELLDHRRFPSRAAIEDHLLGQLVPAVTDQSERTARWLMFLAQHLNSLGTQDLEWWRLSPAGPRAARAVGALLALGAATAVLGWRVDRQTSWFGIGMPVWVPFGVLCLISVADVVFGSRGSPPQYVPRTEPGRMVRPALAVVAVLGGGLLYSWLLQYLLFQVIAAAASVIFSVGHLILRRKRPRPKAPGRLTVEEPLEDLRHGPSDAATRGPERTLREDRLATLVTLGLINVPMGGSAVWRAAGLLIIAAFAPELSLADVRPGTGAITTVVTFVAFAVLGASSSAWCGFGASRVWLWGAGKLPWNVLGLLGEAHRLGVLRQSGAVYQFRHSRLQERLAAQAGEPAPARVPASSSRIEELRPVVGMLSSLVLAFGSIAMGVDMFLLKAESGPYEAVAPVCELVDREELRKFVPAPRGEPSETHDYELVKRYCSWNADTATAGDPVVVIIVDLFKPTPTLTAVERADGFFGHGLPVGPIVSQNTIDLGGVGDEAVTAVGHSEDRPTVATSVRLDNLLVTVTYEVSGLKWGDTGGYARSTGITQDLARTVVRNISDAHP
ncbi:NACHT domain-containing protein [Streptomyces anulatus]|uniref:NACHT domain-containing protein n=1 Tax=Streptomyces TaxID=1883 RepID=UPI001B36A9F1|nr:NACHT domain-containing protein [Streptomyces sp. C3-3]MBQ1118317.1 NACHT domain-containing protein [Streptomyces sp. C3-3]